MLKVLDFFLVALATTSIISAYPSSLSCNTALTSGINIMSATSKADSSRSITVYRGSAQLQSGDIYVPGESLTVSLSNINGIQFIFQAQNANFNNGKCKGLRSLSNIASLTMPQSGSISVWAGWATSYGSVSVSNPFILVSSGLQPSIAPTVHHNLSSASHSAVTTRLQPYTSSLVGIIIGGLLLLIGAVFLNKSQTNNLDLVEETYSTLYSASGIVLAICSIAFVVSWCTEYHHKNDNGFLGFPSWQNNIFAYHPILLVGGFFGSQVFAIASWTVFKHRPTAKIFHVVAMTTALACLIAGVRAVVLHKFKSGSAHIVSVHSWCGISCIALFCMNYALGWYMAITTYLQVSSSPQVDRRHWFAHLGIDLKFIHQCIGKAAFDLTVACIVTGIMDQIGQSASFSSGAASSVSMNIDPSIHYPKLGASLKVAHGLGVVVTLAAVSVSLMIRRRSHLHLNEHSSSN